MYEKHFCLILDNRETQEHVTIMYACVKKTFFLLSPDICSTLLWWKM